MTRNKCIAVGVMLVSAVVVTGQPPAQPKSPVAGFGQPLPLKGVGKVVEVTPQAAAGGWADRLIADLQQFKVDANSPRVPAAARKALTERADAALQKAVALDKSLAQNNRNAWYRDYGEVEAALAELGKAVRQHAANLPVLVTDLDRVNYSSQQVGVALARGDTDADRVKRTIARLSASQEEQSERLRAQVEQLGAAAQPLERQVRQFVKTARQFDKEAAGNAGVEKLRREFATVAAEWQDVLAALAPAPNLPAAVRYQAARVGGLNRRLAEVLEFTPPKPAQPPPPPRKVSLLAVGAGEGMPPSVVVYADGHAGAVQSFFAYNRDILKNGVRVSVADLNGDGMPEIVTTPGGRSLGRIRVFDGRDMSSLVVVDAFDQKVTDFGYFVAAADLTRDGRALVAIAPDAGGPAVVEVYDLVQGKLAATVFPFPKGFTGGTRLAWGDVNGDGMPDLVAASGPGEIGSQVRVFDGTNFTKVLTEFFVVDEKYRNGAWVAAANLTKGNRAEIVVGLDAGARPLVRIFDGQRGKLITEFEPYPETFRGGVRVALGDPDDGARLKIICAPGPGGPRDLPVKIIGPDGKVLSQLDPFPGSNNGMYVGSR